MLRKNKDFSFVYRRGKKTTTPLLGIYCADSKYNIRAGFSVSKKVGNSVIRNKVRRRLKECFNTFLPKINKSTSVVFVARDTISTASYAEMYNTMEHLLHKMGLLD